MKMFKKLASTSYYFVVHIRYPLVIGSLGYWKMSKFIAERCPNVKHTSHPLWDMTLHGCKVRIVIFHNKLNMPQLTKDQRVWICVEYARVNNAEEVRRRWLGHLQNDRVPTRATIKRTFDKFATEGTCLNLNKGRSGRMRTGRTLENIDLVLQSLEENGQRSSRKNGLGLSRYTFNRIVGRHWYVGRHYNKATQRNGLHFAIDLLTQLRGILVFLIN